MVAEPFIQKPRKSLSRHAARRRDRATRHSMNLPAFSKKTEPL